MVIVVVVRLYTFSLASHVIPKRHLTQAQEVSKLPPTQKGNGRRQQGAPVRWRGVLITEVSGNLSGKPVARLLSGISVQGMWHTCCQLALGVDLQAYQGDTVCQDMRGWICFPWVWRNSREFQNQWTLVGEFATLLNRRWQPWWKFSALFMDSSSFGHFLWIPQCVCSLEARNLFLLMCHCKTYFRGCTNSRTCFQTRSQAQTLILGQLSAFSKPGGHRLTKPPPWNVWPSPLKGPHFPVFRSHSAYSSQQITYSSKSFWEGWL